MATQRTESTVTLFCHANRTGSQINTSSGQVLKEFTDYGDYQLNLKAAEAWLAEHGFVHAGGSDFVKYEPLMTGDTSEA
jgi:hypothetical protein